MNQTTNYSKRQFAKSEFLAIGYDFPKFTGTFEGELVCKRWGKSHNLLLYIDLNDGRKIICSAWQSDRFLGAKDLAVDNPVIVKFDRHKRGGYYLSEIKYAYPEHVVMLD